MFFELRRLTGVEPISVGLLGVHWSHSHCLLMVWGVVVSSNPSIIIKLLVKLNHKDIVIAWVEWLRRVTHSLASPFFSSYSLLI